MNKPSPSLLVSVAALVVALGGTSYAAVKVGSEQIADNSVTTQDVKNQTLTSKDVGERIAQGQGPQAGDRSGRRSLGTRQRSGPDRGPVGWFHHRRGVPDPAQHLGRCRPTTASGPTATSTSTPTSRWATMGSSPPSRCRTRSTRTATPSLTAAPPVTTPTRSSPARSRSASAACPALRAPRQAPLSRTSSWSARGCSNGSFTSDNNRKRFYVVITGNSTEYVAP